MARSVHYEFTMAKGILVSIPYLQNIKQSDDMPNPESRDSRREINTKAREAIRRRKKEKYFHDHKLRFLFFSFSCYKGSEMKYKKKKGHIHVPPHKVSSDNMKWNERLVFIWFIRSSLGGCLEARRNGTGEVRVWTGGRQVDTRVVEMYMVAVDCG